MAIKPIYYSQKVLTKLNLKASYHIGECSNIRVNEYQNIANSKKKNVKHPCNHGKCTIPNYKHNHFSSFMFLEKKIIKVGCNFLSH